MSSYAVATIRAPARDATRAAFVAAALLAIAALTALGVAVGGAGETRDWLGFSFPGIPAEREEAIAILANNLRILAAVLVAGIVAQLGRELGQARGAGRFGAAGVGGVLVLACDAAVAGSALFHALIIGAGVGAYGERMVAALLPHGPLELAAYSLAIAVYVAARREPIAPRRWLVIGGLSAGLLVLAAPIEVFLAL